jgi:hypothetical protein
VKHVRSGDPAVDAELLASDFELLVYGSRAAPFAIGDFSGGAALIDQTKTESLPVGEALKFRIVHSKPSNATVTNLKWGQSGPRSIHGLRMTRVEALPWITRTSGAA